MHHEQYDVHMRFVDDESDDIHILLHSTVSVQKRRLVDDIG